jgi:hypothetical protein
MNLKKIIWNVVTSKFIGTGSSFYKKIIYWAALPQRLRNTALRNRITVVFIAKDDIFVYYQK